MKVLVAVDDPRGSEIAAGLEREGIDVVAVVPAHTVAELADDAALDTRMDLHEFAVVEVVVLHTTRDSLTAATVALCDHVGARITPLCDSLADERLAATFGLEHPFPLDGEPWRIAQALSAVPRSVRARAAEPQRPRIIAVWGPNGAPGRSTIAVELAVELARGGRHVGLVDADTHAPSIALSLGLEDEGPGFAAACRQAQLGGLDARELTRIATPLGRNGVEVLTGINRPSRWPELSDARVTAALGVCREWADHTVVDVAASLERDEEIVSDLDGPRRNAATIAALCAADLVVAVVGADPVGVARFLRGYTELRATVGVTPVVVVANRLRPGALGIDARGQVRRALDRFGGIDDVWFLPMDAKAVDAALLAARPVGEIAPRSSFASALRRFVGEAVLPLAASVATEARPRRALRLARRQVDTALRSAVAE